MKKFILAMIGLLAAFAVGAKEKGSFSVYDYGTFKLHVYFTNDALGDASYIAEGDKGLVTLEQPLFKDNDAEFNAYVAKLGKKVVKRVSDYHLGGTGSEAYSMPEGMPDFVKGPVYGGMMKGFADAFGDAIVDMPTGKAEEIPFGSTQKWAGIDFAFSKGAASDFPGASILIGGKVYLAHWAPALAHINSLQISSLDALNAEIAELKKALASGAVLFAGGHGGAVDKKTAEQRLAYLEAVKNMVAQNNDADGLVKAVSAAYPNLGPTDGLQAFAKAVYGK